LKTNKIIIVLLLLMVATSCGVYNSLMNLSKLQFKLGSVTDFRVGDIPINNKSKLNDFGALDIVKLTSGVVSGKFPVTFTVNVLAKNPNKSKDSKSGLSEISLERFPWTLYINDKKTISGDIAQKVNVPAIEDATVIPLQMKLDLIEFFKDDGLNNLVDLALQLGGAKGSSAKLKIVAEPVLGTPLGNITYPEPLTIIDQKFN